ncbi:MAG: lyase family protein, partial [Candidatus Aenigmatarchaeota archaeon]
MMDAFDSISPLDYRYYGRDKDIFSKLSPFLSENARIRYQLKTELALVRVLARRGICPQSVVKDVESAIGRVTAQEVYEREDRIRHDVRALANAIRDKVPDGSKPFVHFTADALVPALLKLEKTIIAIARREKETLQIGRTHGQHAEPITFGFAM